MNIAGELVRKLGIKPYFSVIALQANPEVLAKIRQDLPEGATLSTELPAGVKSNLILIGLTENDDLAEVFQKLRRSIAPAGSIWAVIPKKSAGKGTFITFAQVQAAALQTDLVDNKVASFSDKEYGIRFVIRKEKRGQSTGL